MKTLTLSIKQVYFDQILAGTKKTETREIKPTNSDKYIKYVCNGKEYSVNDELPEGADINIVPIEYDALKLLTGAYKDKRPYIIVECKGAEVYFLTDENGNDITYEYEGETYIAAQIEYKLGNIIEKFLVE